MAVKITEEMHSTFMKNGFTEEDIANTVNHYRGQGQSDEEIFKNLDNKYKSLNNKTTAQPVNNNQTKSEEITQNQDNTESTVLTGGVSQNYTQNWDSKGRIYYTDENGNKVDFKVNPIKKIGNKIKAAAFNTNRWLNETNPNSEAYKQKVNAILTLETLPMGVGKAATQWGASKLMPFLGKKIAQGVAEGAGSGLVGGGVFGAGNAMVEGENPLVGALEGAGGGLVGGAALGGVIGNIAKGIKQRNLQELKSKRKDWGIAYRKASNNPELAVQTLIENKKGFVPKAFHKDGIGDIDLVWGKGGKDGYGLAHIIERRTENGLDGREFVKNLPSIIENGKVIRNPKQPNIAFIKNDEDSALIKLVWDDKKRKWIVTAFKDKKALEQAVDSTPDIVNIKGGMTTPPNSSSATNIIPDNAENLNPLQQSDIDNLIESFKNHYSPINDNEEFQSFVNFQRAMKNVDSGKYNSNDVAIINEMINEIDSAGYDKEVALLRKKYKNLGLEDFDTYMHRTENTNEHFNPNITKSEDIKNISKKDMATNKREFKQSVEDLKAPKTAKTTIKMRNKNKYWSKNIDDPYTRATQEADEEFNSILNEIKKNPEVLNDEAKTMEFEARLDKKTSSLDNEHAQDYWNKYWDAFSKGADYNQTKGNFDALGGREYKTRGAVNTISRKINSDVANSITDSKYLTRGYDVNKAQLDNMSMEEIQKLIESDDISDLSVTARAMDINRDLENGVIPLWKLNKWAADGTPIGQAMQARSLLKMDTPEGAIQVLAGTIRKATPKKVNDIIDNIPKLVEASNGGESALNETLKRVNKNERKYLIDKIMDLKNKGELTNDNLVKVINKKYNVPEITDLDYKNIQKLTADIQNATDERQTEVAKGLLRKYIGDKIPREFMNKVNTYRYTNMLLSPKSRVKDFLFTGLFQGEQALDEIIANGISKGLTQPIKGVKTRNGLHFNDWFQGLKKGLKEGAEDVKLGITTGRAGEGTRFDLPKSAQFRHKPLNEVEGFKKVPQALENVMSGLEKAVNYTIRVPDRMFYEGRYASSLADQLQSQGLKEATPEIIEQAVKEAKDAVYQGDTWASKASLGIRDTLNKIPLGAFKVGDWTMPFVQTVANISEEGLKNIGGIPVGAYKWLKADTPEALREAEILTAKGVKGLLPMSVGWGIGKGYIDSNIGEKTNYNNEITGMQPQSIAIGDKSFSLANAPNLAVPIAVGRAVGEKGLTREGVMQALLNSGMAVSDMPAVKAIGDLTSIASSGYGQQLTPSEIVDNAVRNQGVNYISQLVPLSGLQRNIRNVIDPYGRELYTENTLEYISNRLINGIPFASQTLPLKYNAMGEPVMVDNIQNPVARAIGQGIDLGIRNYNKNATNETLNELSKKMEDSDTKGKNQIALKKSKRTIKVNGKNIKLDNKQYSKYQQEYGRLNYVLRDRALNNPEFANLSDEEKTEYLMELRQSVEEAVKIKQFGHEPTRKYKPYTQQILENYEEYIGE